VQAKGGVEALKAVRTVVVDADMSVNTARGPTIIPTKTYVAYPDKFRVDATFAGQQSIQAYNSGSAWVKDPAGVSAAPMRNATCSVHAERTDFSPANGCISF